MKLFGETVDALAEEIIAIPRKGKDIVFIVQGIPDMEPFYKICPKPEPPVVMLPGGKKKIDSEDKFYKGEIEQYAKKRYDWIIITSLKNTPGLTWDTVDYNDSSTWANYIEEFKNAKFSDIEVGNIINAVINVNMLNEDRVEEARQRFLATREAQQNGRGSPTIEQNNMPSGEPVKDSH